MLVWDLPSGPRMPILRGRIKRFGPFDSTADFYYCPALTTETIQQATKLCQFRCQSSLFKLLALVWMAKKQEMGSNGPCQFVGDPIHDLGGVGAQPRCLRLGNDRPSGNGLSIPQWMLISLGCRAFATRLLTPTLDKRWHKSNAKDKTQLTSASPVFGSRSPSSA